MNAGFPRTRRLLLGADFERVMRKGRKVHTPNLIVFAASGDRDEPRLGLAVGRRVGKAACRNRWKRLVREVFRLRLQHRLPPIDLVVAVRAAEGRARPAPGRPAPRQRLARRIPFDLHTALQDREDMAAVIPAGVHGSVEIPPVKTKLFALDEPGNLRPLRGARHLRPDRASGELDCL